jgi:hypothetical protein
MRVAFEELLNRFAGFRLDPAGEITYSTSLGQGIMSLPMIFTRA